MTTPQMQIAELNRRMLAGEDVTEAEIIAGIQLLRADREDKTKSKKIAVVAKESEAKAGEDILTNLI
jgi:hypothetical protein